MSQKLSPKSCQQFADLEYHLSRAKLPKIAPLETTLQQVLRARNHSTQSHPTRNHLATSTTCSKPLHSKPPNSNPPCSKYYLLKTTPLEATSLKQQLLLRVPPFFQLSSKPIHSESNIPSPDGGGCSSSIYIYIYIRLVVRSRSAALPSEVRVQKNTFFCFS